MIKTPPICRIVNPLIVYLLIAVSCLAASLPMLTRAQTTPTVSSSQAPLSIDGRIAEQNNRINQLQHLLRNKATLPTITLLLKRLPVSAENINEKIQNLSEATISTQTITDIVQLSDELKRAIEQHQAFLDKLQEGNKQLNSIDEQLTALQQLLSNPINQNNVSDNNQRRLLELSDTLTATVRPAFQNDISNTIQHIDLAKQAVSLLDVWKNHLTQKLGTSKSSTLQTKHLDVIKQQQKSNEAEIIRLTTTLNRQRHQLNLSEIEKLQTQIYQKQMQLWLLSIDASLLYALNELPTIVPNTQPDTLATVREHQHDRGTTSTPNTINNNIQLDSQFAIIQQVRPQIDRLYDEVKERQSELKQYIETSGPQPELTQALDQRLQTLGFQQLQLKQLQQQLEHRLSQHNQAALFTRNRLFLGDSLEQIMTNVGNAFVQIAFQVQISFKSLYQQVLLNPWQILLIAGITLLATYLIIRQLSRWITRSALKKGVEIGLIATLRKLFYALRRQAYLLIFLIFVSALVRFSETPSPSDSIIRTLVYTLIGFILWWEMTAIEVKLGTVEKRAAHRSNIVAVLLAVFVLLYSLSKLSAVSVAIVDFYGRALMLAMIIFVWVIQKNIARYLRGEQDHIHNKAYRIYRTAVTILPKAIIAVCLLGVIGFAQLAWLILSYIGMFVIYFTVISLGVVVLNIFRKKLKLASIKQFEHGAFIAQDIINPLSLLSKGLWILLCTALLSTAIGWYSGSSFLLVKLLQWLNTPLFSFGNNSISSFSLLLLIASPFILFRVARWLKTFSYHWLFAGINDLGVRSSLSIFSQYVAALIGVLITLKVVGIDLTSLAVFAGALGVGVGLGLQDIAKNFISGILLLIERPLRSGDWVAIDGSEGTVKSIGMRAITIETFDNQEVIIPNGNAISNSFTNYTHSNSLIRTVLYVGAGYTCDPEKVIQILNQILSHTDAILTEPRHQVVMWEYADSSINYRIQYYIDLNNSGLWETKTAVLKAIWYAFKANDIEIPFPQRDINFRNLLTTGVIDDLGQTQDDKP